MANEARVSAGLTIRKTSGTVTLLDYRRSPTFNADVTGSKGPTPGALTIPTGGKVVSLEELSTPGLCLVTNNDATAYVEYGVLDVGADIFYPFGELLPGEATVFRFSRNFQEEYVGTGTGTTSQGNRLFMKAHGNDAVVTVEAFEK